MVKKIIEDLKAIGFKPDSIIEIILCTRNHNNTVNAAPMGVKLLQNGFLEIKPFKTSKTYNNLKRNNETCINITCDPWIFFSTAFKEETDSPIITKDLVIKDALVSVTCIVVEFDDSNEKRGIFMVKPVMLKVYNESPLVFSRGVAQAIEAIIHATRVKAYTEQDRLTEADNLKEKIMECVEVIDRVSAKDTQEYRVARKILELIDEWGTKE